MAEQRKSTESICVKTSAKLTLKIELFPAEQWSKSAQGRFRLRINRRWLDSPEGEPVYMDKPQVGAFVASVSDGIPTASVAPMPHLPHGTRVSVPNGRSLAGQKQYDGAWTRTEPFLGYDGRYYVSVHTVSQGGFMAAVEELIVHKKR